jgi:cellulose synthase/poly-beta-1,6-N-acetylglucosamine synthase-like glycosyltransferase
MMKARGDVVIFTDANAMIDREAVSRIVKRFTDPKVGLVSGRSIYLDSKDCTERVGGGYRSYEEKIKELEGQVGSIVGADGALYALRRSLYRTLRQEYINDLIHPVEVVLRGYRAVSEPTAICRETVDEKHQGEMRRQTRIMAQSWLVFCSQIGRLLKAGKWLYAWQFTSHKLCRWLALPFLATTYASALMLAVHSTFYLAVAFFLTTFLVLAAVGKNLPIGLLRFPHFFLLVHLAALVGLYRYLSGSAFITWTPRND